MATTSSQVHPSIHAVRNMQTFEIDTREGSHFAIAEIKSITAKSQLRNFNTVIRGLF